MPMQRSLRAQRGLSVMEIVMVTIIIGIIGAFGIVKYVDLQAVASQSVSSFNEGSTWARLTAAGHSNYRLSQQPTGGRREAIEVRHCQDGARIVALLDDRSLAGGLGGFWPVLNGVHDVGNMYSLGPDDSLIPHGEMRECTATRAGKNFTFMVTGCRTWEAGCRCATYASDCGTM